MEIIYNNQRLWLVHIGEAGKQTSKAVCLDENKNKVIIELNIAVCGCYIFPPKAKKNETDIF